MNGYETAVRVDTDDFDEERQMHLCCCPGTDPLESCLVNKFPGPIGNIFKGMSTGPMLATVVWTVLAVYLNCVSQVYTQKLASEANVYNVSLPDLGFYFIPKLEGFPYADIAVFSLLGLTFVRFLITPMRWTFLRRWVLILGTMFLLRSATIVATILPNPYPDCNPEKLGNPWIEAFKILSGQLKTCADVFFSGHTVNLTLCALAWHQYSHLTPLSASHKFDGCYCGLREDGNTDNLIPCTIDKTLIWLVAIAGYFLILATHFHYLIDILIGIWLSAGVWKLYHHYIRTAHQRYDLFNRVIFWMEKDAMDFNVANGKLKCLPPLCQNCLNRNAGLQPSE